MSTLPVRRIVSAVWDYPKALAVLEHGRQLAPDDADLLPAEGNLERYLGQGDAAVRDLRAATQLDPRSASAAGRLATALAPISRNAVGVPTASTSSPASIS